MPRIRLDRLLTLGLVHPLRRVCLGPGELRVPFLMYHSISDSAEEKVSPYYRVATRPAVFAEQMALLRAEGWQAVGVKRGCELLRRGGPAADKVAVITFDDGFRDFYSHAFPVLRQNGFSATMYLPTAFIGRQPIEFKERECLTWDEVRELHQAGIEFGSHTVNHPKLYDLDAAHIKTELEMSKQIIEQELGAPVCSFAYPYAFPSADPSFVEKFVSLLKNAGYETNVTTRIGRVRAGDDPFTLKRLPVNSADDGALFLAKIRGAYDWMNWPQDTLKKMKGLRGHAKPRPCCAP